METTAPPARSDKELLRAFRKNDLAAVKRILAALSPPDVAEALEGLRGDDRVYQAFLALEAAVARRVLPLVPGRWAAILSRLPLGDAAHLLSELPMDEGAQVLSSLPEVQRERLLGAMRPGDASEVRALLGYPPGSCGRLMTEKFVRVGADMRAGEVIQHLRRVDPEVETFTNVYVVDASGILVGVTSLRDVIRADPDRRLAEFMATRIVSVRPETEAAEAARLVAKYDFLALPVVAADGRALGILTVDDLIHVLTRKETAAALRMGAVEGGAGAELDRPYFATTIWSVVRKRVNWLVLLFVTEQLTNLVMTGFQAEMEKVIALAIFVPLLIGTGGNAGSQTVSTVIRAMSLGEIRLKDLLRVLGRETLTGLALGVLLGVIAFLRGWLWHYGVALSLTLGVSVLAICTWANLVGSLIPIAARRAGIDPTVVSSPLIATVVDATGLLIYFSVARAILPQL